MIDTKMIGFGVKYRRRMRVELKIKNSILDTSKKHP